jgi:hypothetical protein
MTSLETLSDDIELMRGAGAPSIPMPLDLADYLLTCAFFIRAQQGHPTPPIRARSNERTAHDARND